MNNSGGHASQNYGSSGYTPVQNQKNTGKGGQHIGSKNISTPQNMGGYGYPLAQSDQSFSGYADGFYPTEEKASSKVSDKARAQTENPSEVISEMDSSANLTQNIGKKYDRGGKGNSFYNRRDEGNMRYDSNKKDRNPKRKKREDNNQYEDYQTLELEDQISNNYDNYQKSGGTNNNKKNNERGGNEKGIKEFNKKDDRNIELENKRNAINLLFKDVPQYHYEVSDTVYYQII